MWEDMSNVGFAVAERYVSSFCWFSRWEGECVRRRVALGRVSRVFTRVCVCQWGTGERTG